MRSLLALIAGAILLCLAGQASAQGIVSPYKKLSAAGTNSTLVLGRKSLVGYVAAFNTTATLYYLKLYNKATAPTCGTDVPVQTYALPANGGFVLPPGGSLNFPLGVGLCITTGFADNDTGAAAAGVVVNVGVTGQ